MYKKILIVLCAIMPFVACTKDSSYSVLIGTWKFSTMTNDSYLTFNKDNTFEYTSKTPSLRAGTGTYSYNVKQHSLVLSYTDKMRTDVYIVQTVSSSQLVLMDPDLYAWTFTKQ